MLFCFYYLQIGYWLLGYVLCVVVYDCCFFDNGWILDDVNKYI